MVQGKELFQKITSLSSNAEKTAYSLSLHTASLSCQKDEAAVLKYACITLQHTDLSQLTQRFSVFPDLSPYKRHRIPKSVPTPKLGRMKK